MPKLLSEFWKSKWYRMLFVFSTTFFIILVLSSVTTSSLNFWTLRENTSFSTGLIFGQPNPTRGDEFARATPRTLGYLKADSPVAESPLAATAQQPDSSIYKSLRFLTGLPEKPLTEIAKLLPRPQGFALLQWLEIWIFSISLIYWFFRMGLSAGQAVWGLTLTIFSPVAAWWSWWPINIMGTLLLSLVLTDLALSELRRRKFLTIAFSFLAISELVAFVQAYSPWVFVYGLVVGLPLFVYSVMSSGLTRKSITFILASFSVLGIWIYTLYTFLKTPTEVLSKTSYPGTRHIVNAPQSLSDFLDAPFNFVLQQHIGELNGSELSSPWSVLLLLIPILAMNRSTEKPIRIFQYISASTVGFLLIWTLAILPDTIVNKIPILPMVPPNRVGSVLAIAAIIYLFSVINSCRNEFAKFRTRISFSIFILVLISGTLVVNNGQFPLSPTNIFISAVILTIISWLAFTESKTTNVLALLSALLFSLYSIAVVQPIQYGLGDLDKDSAKAISEMDAKVQASVNQGESAFWAADTWELPALMIANHIPTINGEQSWGPSDNWSILDPTKSQFESYNRGASVIYVSWLDGESEPSIATPQADQIVITVGPCNSKLKKLGVAAVIASRPLQGACLKELGTIEWATVTRYAYSIN